MHFLPNKDFLSFFQNLTFFWEIALRVNYHYSTHPTAYGQTRF